jgi:L-lactate dehydrogenase (cytochrome)
VENVLDLMRDGLGSALVGLGHRSITELSPDDLVIPPGFERHLGEPGADAPVAARSAGKGTGA